MSTSVPTVLVAQDDSSRSTETQQDCVLQPFDGSSVHRGWPYAYGAGGYAIQHTISDAVVAEPWEELCVLTTQDKLEYEKWISSLC